MLSRIRPVRYKWNGLWGRLNDDTDIVGVIGQELESVAPYTIVKSKGKLYPEGQETDIIQIDPTPIIFLLINGVKDLRNQVEAIEKVIRSGHERS